MYVIDGVPLSDPQRRWRVHRSTERRTPAAFRSVDVTVPGVDGSLPIYGEQVEATALKLVLNVYGTGAVLEERVNFLRALLGKTYGPLILSKPDNGRTVTTEAKPAAISEPVSTGVYVQLSATLTIPSGTWRGPQTTWEHPAPQSSDAATVQIPSSRPITDSRILISGPATAPIVTDVATGATVRFMGSVPVGESLLIVCDEWRAVMAEGGHFTWIGNWSTSEITNTGPLSDVTLLPLTPQPQSGLTFSPRITFAASGTTTETRVQVRAHGSFI